MVDDMGIDREGLRRVVEVTREFPQGTISAERAMDLLRGTGLACRLACRLETRRLGVRVDSLTHENVRPMEVEVETPLTMQSIILDHSRIGPDAWERQGRFDWHMDRFGLLVSAGEAEAFVGILGPFTALLGRGRLRDETVPSVGVHDLASSVVEVLTGETIEPGPYVGAGFTARHMSEQAAERLERLLGEVPPRLDEAGADAGSPA